MSSPQDKMAALHEAIEGRRKATWKPITTYPNFEENRLESRYEVTVDGATFEVAVGVPLDGGDRL